MEVKINNKILAFTGCIGRREFILNAMIINAISSFLSFPLSLWMSQTSQTPYEMLNFPALFAAAPISLMFLYTIACLMCIIFHFGLMSRRIADIKEHQVNPLIYLGTGILILAPYAWLLFMNSWTVILLFITTIISIIIIATPGKITSQLPHNELKRFNWGAFWGTWIWGLFNKTYITLWTIILFFTPASLCWAIICGIKGNEWAFKNTKALDSEKFHKGQKNQAIFWNSFAGFMIFIFPILLGFIIIGATVATTIKNPEAMETFVDKTSDFFEEVIISNFDDYELDIDENKFYMNPEEWIKLTYDEKYNLLKSASSFASMKKSKSSEPKFEGYSGYSSSEMMITKIYSSYNGEILAEFRLEDLDNANDFKSIFNAALKSVRLNTTPELPPNER